MLVQPVPLQKLPDPWAQILVALLAAHVIFATEGSGPTPLRVKVDAVHLR